VDFVVGLLTGVLAGWIWYSARRMSHQARAVSEAESRLARRVYTLQGKLTEMSALVRELEFERLRARGLIRFRPETTLAEAYAVHPRVREVLAAFGLGGGGGCAGGGGDETATIAQACAEASLDSRGVLDALARFLRDPEGPIEARAASARIHQIRTLPPSRN
jgi:hypothetical protein